MAFKKFATCDITDVRYSANKVEEINGAAFKKLAKPQGISNDGYLYAQVRAISSRVNKNNDGWPSEELARSYATFEGRPVFVDHNNDDPERTRGVVAWADLHVEDDEKVSAFDEYYASAPDNHRPPTWVELLIEVDAKTFPKLATHILNGDIDAVSMGANIETTKCSVCDNEANSPADYCDHIKRKGIEFEVVSSEGEKIKKKSYEDCYGVNFFEISFVFDPADTTALVSDVRKEAKTAETMDYNERGERCPHCKSVNMTYSGDGTAVCQSCGWKGESAGQAIPAFDPSDPRGASAHQKEAILDLIKPQEDNTDFRTKKDRNYSEPQSEQMTAPTEVDTLRNDHVCPQCGGEMDEDRTGLVTCETCGYELEPEGFDRPDLELAKEIDMRSDQEQQDQEPDMMNELRALEQQRAIPDPGVSPTGPPQSPIRAVNPVNPLASIKTAASVETALQMPGIHMRTMAELRNSGLEAQIAFEDGTRVIIHPQMGRQEMFEMMKAQTPFWKAQQPYTVQIEAADDNTVNAVNEIIQRNMNPGGMRGPGAAPMAPGTAPPTAAITSKRTIPTGVINEMNVTQTPVTLNRLAVAGAVRHLNASAAEGKEYDDERELLDDLHNAGIRATKWEAAAALEHFEVESAKRKQVIINNTPKTKGTDEPVEEKVKSDQLKPVESATEEDSEMEKESDRKVIKRTEEDGSGVKRTEEIIEENDRTLGQGESETPAQAEEETEGEESEESGETETSEDSSESESSDPFSTSDNSSEESDDDDDKTSFSSVSPEEKLLAALRLAKLATDLGLITAETELDYAAKHESESLDQIEARADVLKQVKEAGLTRAKSRPVVAGRMPSFTTAAHNGHTEEIELEQIFLG